MARSSLILALSVATSALARVASAQLEGHSFEQFADSLMTAELASHHIPGAVLAAVRDGRVAFARGFGYADLSQQVPVDPERTMFRVASVSKLLTATAAMQLVERGRLDLHADVNTYLRRFRVPATHPEPVTLFHLLTHTAGFDDRNIARKAYRASDVEPLGEYLARRLPERIRPPGEFIGYSNHGMALAGYLVEVVSGMPFERYMKEQVFAPLGMDHSSFAVEPDSAALLATGYEGDPPEVEPRDYTKTTPASMLAMSGTDAARFMLAHLAAGVPNVTRILADSSLNAMHRRQFSQHPRIAGIGLGFWERFQHGERGLWHDGDAAGFASLLYLVPERRIGYFLAFNSRSGNRARREILAALLDRDLPPFPRHVPPAVDTRPERFTSRFAGTYVDARHGHRTMERLAALARFTSITASGAGELRHEGARYVTLEPGLFEREDGDGRLAFGTDPAGHVTQLFEARSIARTYERVPWYGTPLVQLAWLLLCVLGFLWQVGGALVRWVAGWAGRRTRLDGEATLRGVGVATTLASVVNLAFLVGLGAAIAGVFGSLEHGIPGILAALLTLPLLTTAATILALVASASTWRRDCWRRSRSSPGSATGT